MVFQSTGLALSREIHIARAGIMNRMRIAYMPCATIDDGRRRAIDYMRDEWDIDAESIELITEPAKLMRNSLFGDVASILQCSDSASLRSLDAMLASDAERDGAIGDGLMIVSTVMGNRKEAKAIIKTVKAYDGIVFDDRVEQVGKLIAKLHVNKSIADEMGVYAGTDVSMVIPVVNELSKLPPNVQAKLTWDEIRIRLDSEPGDVPPWRIGYGRDSEPGLDEYINANDAKGVMMKTLRVIDGGANPLGITSWLKKTYLQVLALHAMDADGFTGSQSAEALGLPDPKYSGKGMKDPKYGKSGYPTKKAMRLAASMDEGRIVRILTAINRAETDLKAGSMHCRLTPRNIMIRMVSDICD